MRPLTAIAFIAVLACQAAQAAGPFDEQRAAFCGAKADSQRLSLLESIGRLEVAEGDPGALSDEAIRLVQSFVHEASKESCEEGWGLGYALGGGQDPDVGYGPPYFGWHRD